MNRNDAIPFWYINRIQSIAVSLGLFGTVCTILSTILAIAILLIVSLIPLYLSRNTEEPVGELYCIKNYTMTVGFQIPQYNTTFNESQPTDTQSFTTSTVAISGGATCSRTGAISGSVKEDVTIDEACTFQTLSIISPAVPNATVFNSYALSEACYRTLQSCYYDPLMISCLMSNCVVVSLTSSSTTASYPLTNYTLQCTANVYYKVRCADSAASRGLFYSSSQQNSACREQRMNRINSCLNSTVQLANVPCLITVSSGLITKTIGTCYRVVQALNHVVSLLRTGTACGTISPGAATSTATPTLPVTTFSYTAFSASDQAEGHSYRISTINSQNYTSSQLGALYCGAATLTQIFSTINTAINSQGST